MKEKNITNATINNINTAGHTIPRALNRVLGFDYNKPHNIYEITGNFTLNQVKKEVETAGYNPYNATIAIIVKDHNFNEYNLATVTGAGFDIDYKTPYFETGYYERNKAGRATLDHFFNKSDFNDERKNPTAHAFIICQLNQYKNPLKAPKTENPDYNNRFILKDIRFYGYMNKAGSFVNSLELIRTDAAGEKIEINKNYFGRDLTEASAIIDKSGYLLTGKRDELNRRARALKAAREKEKYTATNNAASIQALKARIDAKKAEIINALENATTAAELKTVCEKLNRWNGLPDIFAHYETIKERDSKKDYADIASYNASYNRLVEKINEL